MRELQIHLKIYIIIVGDFNIPISVIDRKKQQEITKDDLGLNNIIKLQEKKTHSNQCAWDNHKDKP